MQPPTALGHRTMPSTTERANASQTNAITKEGIINSISVDAGASKGEDAEGFLTCAKSPEEFLNYLTDKSTFDALNLNSMDDQIDFLTEVFSKLDFLNDELQNSTNPMVNPENFKQSWEIVERGMLEYFYDKDPGFAKLNKIDEAYAAKKTATLNFPPVMDAHGDAYEKINDTVTDGNCGLNACKRTTDKWGAFNSAAERSHLLNVIKENKQLYSFGKLYAAVTDSDLPRKIRDAANPELNSKPRKPEDEHILINTVFGSLEDCKSFLDRKLTHVASGNALQSQDTVKDIQKKIQTSANLKELLMDTDVLNFIFDNDLEAPRVLFAFDLNVIFGSLSNCKSFLDKKLSYELNKGGLTVNTEIRLRNLQKKSEQTKDLHVLFADPDVVDFLYRSSSFEFSPTADKDNDWLTIGDIQANMLSRGFDCIDNGIRDDGKAADENAHTVLKFKHVANGRDAYIASNSTPLSKYESKDQKEGTHWVCVEKLPAAKIK